MEFLDISEDEYDRYKVLKPVVQKHKRYFFIQNLQKVADNLQVQPIYLVKYICIKSNCSYEVYQKSNYLIKTSLAQIQVEEFINEFTNTYLKCNKCTYLEFQIKVNKDKNLVQSKCASCGNYKTHDLKDEMNNFILNNPPIVKKKHDIEISRGFLNELNQDYNFSDDEDEDVQYSYDESDEDEENQVDQSFQQEEQSQQESSSDISFENDDDQEFEDQEDRKEEQEKSNDQIDKEDNQNTNEDEQSMQSSSSQNSQIMFDQSESFQEIEIKNRLDHFIQTNQQKQLSISNLQYHQDLILMEQCTEHKLNKFEMAQS